MKVHLKLLNTMPTHGLASRREVTNPELGAPLSRALSNQLACCLRPAIHWRSGTIRLATNGRSRTVATDQWESGDSQPPPNGRAGCGSSDQWESVDCSRRPMGERRPSSLDQWDGSEGGGGAEPGERRARALAAPEQTTWRQTGKHELSHSKAAKWLVTI